MMNPAVVSLLVPVVIDMGNAVLVLMPPVVVVLGGLIVTGGRTAYASFSFFRCCVVYACIPSAYSLSRLSNARRHAYPTAYPKSPVSFPSLSIPYTHPPYHPSCPGSWERVGSAIPSALTAELKDSSSHLLSGHRSSSHNTPSPSDPGSRSTTPTPGNPHGVAVSPPVARSGMLKIRVTAAKGLVLPGGSELLSCIPPSIPTPYPY